MPAVDLEQWAQATFIAEDAVLANEEHAHLRFAHIGFLWTNVANGRQGRRVLGQAERGDPQGSMGRWARARAEQQIKAWFGSVPDFIATFDAGYASQCGDAEFCALVEHELMHMGQAKDIYGAPKFNRFGTPVWTIRGHDVEEFVSVVRRYGMAATGVEEMVKAANRGPQVAPAMIAHACGTCLARAA